MATYKIAEDSLGNFHIVKVTYDKATIIPPDWKTLKKVYCESVDDIVKLEDFGTVKRVTPTGLDWLF